MKIPLNKYKFLIFDVDETLLDFRKSEHWAFHQTLNSHGILENHAQLFKSYRQISTALWDQLEKNLISKDKLKVHRYELLLQEHSLDEHNPESLSEQYLHNLTEKVFLIDQALEVCKHLAQTHTLGIITNGIESVQKSRLQSENQTIAEFDIQGVEITGKVTSIRKIKWTSFEPNFFILLQPGSIDDAPKTHILSLPHINNENKALLQNELAHKFSNISIIDVARTVESVLAQAEKMSWSLELMAWLALLTGYIVIFTIVRTNMQSRFWEWNMLKILGASGKQIYQLALGELATTTVIASITGIVLSHLLAFILSQFIFSGSFKVNLFSSISSFIIINSIAMLVGWISARSIIKKEALGVLTNK